MSRNYLYALLLAGALVGACKPGQKLVKQAQIQSNAGMYEDAANLYYNILLNDPKNKEAKAGLQQNAQKVLADKFAKFSKQVIDGNIEEALKTYTYAQGYTRNAAKVGVTLNWPGEYDEVYADILQEYSSREFDAAIALMQNRKYEAAEKVFERIAQFDSNYKNVSVLRLNTVLDPLYQKATRYYEAGAFKDAYYAFDKVVQIDDGYKDARKMRNLSLQQATATVGVLPLINRANAQDNLSLPEDVADMLSAQQGAYVKIANVQVLHKDLESRGFANLKTLEQAIEAGASLNLGYVVLMQLDTFSYTKNKPEVFTREAYEAITESILNPYTQTYSRISKFKKATYTDKTEGQYLKLSVRYYLIQVKTKQILLEDVVKIEKKDELHAAVYAGNPANLYPTLPEGNFLPQVSQEWREMFYRPRKNLTPMDELLGEALEEAAVRMAHQLQYKLR